ncbi:hypothetical protein DITRI_Ditri14bG0035400 [Diplodiscus trichospermus]
MWRYYKSQHEKVLESVTEVSDIGTVIEQAEEADQLFSIQHPTPNFLPFCCSLDFDCSNVLREIHGSNELELVFLLPFEGLLNPTSSASPSSFLIERIVFFQLVMVVDGRDSLFYRCPDLEIYAREIDEHKRTLLLVNKADLLPVSTREKWAKFFCFHKIFFMFLSAKASFAALEGKLLTDPWKAQNSMKKSDDPDTKVYGKE